MSDPTSPSSDHPAASFGGPTDEELDTRPPRRGRRRVIVVTASVAAFALACGGVAWAADSSSSPSAPPTGYGPPAGGGPGGGGRPAEMPSGATGSGSSATPPKHTPQLVGTVKSSGNSTILITDFDGFTRTIKVTSATKYENSLTATPKAGTKIEAEGKVDADGTSLDATVIEAPRMHPGGPGGPGGRPGGPGGPGAHGPGGHGPGRPPANGSKPTAPTSGSSSSSAPATPAAPSGTATS